MLCRLPAVILSLDYLSRANPLHKQSSGYLDSGLACFGGAGASCPDLNELSQAD